MEDGNVLCKERICERYHVLRVKIMTSVEWMISIEVEALRVPCFIMETHIYRSYHRNIFYFLYV